VEGIIWILGEGGVFVFGRVRRENKGRANKGRGKRKRERSEKGKGKKSE
jgi:hypothetical protein